MNEADDEDFALEDEVQRAMEEIVDKEKDMRQLVSVTNSLFDRNQEL